MLTIKQIKQQIKMNEWELRKAIIDSKTDRVIELNSARVLLLESLVEMLDTKLNQKQLVAKVS